jgi:hypothetical protein
LAAKVAKTHGGGTPDGDARTISRGHIQNACSKAEAGHDGYPCINPARHRLAGGQWKKEATDKEIQVDPTDADKKLRISAELEAK